MITRRLISSILLASTVGLGLAACGSSGTSSTSSTPKPTQPAGQGQPSASTGSSAADDAAIKANWVAFFNPKTPVAKRVSLLEDGSQFASIIKSQAGSTLASQATAQVTKVTLMTSSEAEVVYSILLAGTPELKNQTGEAVLQNGTWKVGVASFCGLLTLENGGSSKSLPAACKPAA